MSILTGFFTQVSNFTKSIASVHKISPMESPSRFSDYVSNCSLIPIGSFALDCMRQNKLSIDAALVFHNGKISSKKLSKFNRENNFGNGAFTSLSE